MRLSGRERAQQRSRVAGRIRQAEKHQAGHGDRGQGVQADGGIDLGHVAALVQPAGAGERPLMIRTDDQPAETSGRGIAQERAAMGTDVMEGADAVVSADEQDRSPPDPEGDEVARRGQLARRAGEEPGAAPDGARTPARRRRRSDSTRPEGIASRGVQA